jgi:hypothetical protein
MAMSVHHQFHPFDRFDGRSPIIFSAEQISLSSRMRNFITAVCKSGAKIPDVEKGYNITPRQRGA